VEILASAISTAATRSLTRSVGLVSGRPLHTVATFATVTAKPGDFTVGIGRYSADLRLSVRVPSG
jgi:hypothetical protein